ncbi:hypothetical protein [Aeromonas salmonicida]|uniref:hypothetical protein n=1 Tax=Aeromonas salmonicida TaxID=645 RepID=UPI003D24BA9F
MALPWLIGAAVIGLGSYIVSKMDEDESPDSGDEERRRRERAEEERTERNRAEQRQAVQTALIQHGNTCADDFSQLLEGYIDVKYASKFAYQAVLNEAGELHKRNVDLSFVSDYELDFLDDTTKKNLHHFETFYAVELYPSPTIYDSHNKLCDYDEVSEELQFYRSRLLILGQNIKNNA